MLGFTGRTPTGRRVSVQGSGMGQPSLSIYVNELADSYGAKTIIRVGSCGALQPDIKTREIILAVAASSETNANAREFNGMTFAPVADWGLLHDAYHAAGRLGIPVRVGGIVAVELFYDNKKPEGWKLWAEHGVLAVEMESAALYTLAAQKRFRALTILTVSDVLPTGEQVSANDRQSTFADMVRIALEIA